MKTETFYVARAGWISNVLYDEEQVGTALQGSEQQFESYLLSGAVTRDKPPARPKKAKD